MTSAFFTRAPVARATQAEPFRKTKAVHALTSSASNDAYTPPDVLEAARQALGGSIDLDPASCAVANEEVGAGRYFIEGADPSRCAGGLFMPWDNGAGGPATVWLNPPGGFVHRETLLPAVRGMSQACAWWRKLRTEYRAGRVQSACFYVFRLDVLQNIQALEGCEPPQAFPFVILKARPRHWTAATPREKRGKQGQPTHACAVFFLPEEQETMYSGLAPKRESVERFADAFAPLGYVRL